MYLYTIYETFTEIVFFFFKDKEIVKIGIGSRGEGQAMIKYNSLEGNVLKITRT